MMLPICCQGAIEAGKSREHSDVCPRRPPEPPAGPETEPLFDYPSHPLIDVWAVLRDQDIPVEVGQRLLDRQRAVRAGEQPAVCPEDDKPFLARHIVPAPPVQDSSTVSRTSADAPGHQRTEVNDA
ncbi:hypothetical protein ABGB18_11260 [Nonomuraea sp. B12E4]|uniref:hypothetical protein n=1 Tax=Nonomuraea sp. B12E4 TaxID=3153564 RepID=UPI00325C4DD2